MIIFPNKLIYSRYWSHKNFKVIWVKATQMSSNRWINKTRHRHKMDCYSAWKRKIMLFYQCSWLTVLCYFQVYGKVIKLHMFFFKSFSYLHCYRTLSGFPCAVQYVLVVYYKEGNSDMCYNMNGSWEHYTEWNINTHKNILYDSTYTRI